MLFLFPSLCYELPQVRIVFFYFFCLVSDFFQFVVSSSPGFFFLDCTTTHFFDSGVINVREMFSGVPCFFFDRVLDFLDVDVFFTLNSLFFCRPSGMPLF